MTESDKELRDIVLSCVNSLQSKGPNEAPVLVDPVRKALQERGLGPNCHVGEKIPKEDKKRTIEWYAGQLLDVVDSEAWYAVNSIINSSERFLND